VNRSKWIDKSACAYSDLRLLNAWDLDVEDFREEAIRVCAECPVRKYCYKDAVEDRTSMGVRAGVVFVQRSEAEHEKDKNGPKVPEYIEVS
jgi:hypothetical protein